MLLELLNRPRPRLFVSERDCGSAFSIDRPDERSLRLVDVSKPIVHSKGATKKLGRRSAMIGGKAYVLHPEPDTRAQFEAVLRTLGLTSVEFDHEDQLLRSLTAESPEIVLWGIPGCSASDLERLRSFTQGQSLPVVVVSALGDDLTAEDVQDAGACDLLTLPLPCHRLAPALAIALLRYEIQEALLAEHEDEYNRRAARNLVWRAARVWAKRRRVGEAEALRNILFRSHSRDQTLTRIAMEVVAEGLFP